MLLIFCKQLSVFYSADVSCETLLREVRFPSPWGLVGVWLYTNRNIWLYSARKMIVAMTATPMIRKRPMMQPEEIRKRCGAIGLQRGRLAEIAPCSPTTISRVFSGKSSRTDSLDRLGDAVEAEELRLRDYLLGLHPLEPAKEAAE
jgi:hypothetical protein